MTNEKFKIEPVERKCPGFVGNIPCPFSYEHTKFLLVNGCQFPEDPGEFSTITCSNCLSIQEKAKTLLKTLSTFGKTQKPVDTI